MKIIQILLVLLVVGACKGKDPDKTNGDSTIVNDTAVIPPPVDTSQQPTDTTKSEPPVKQPPGKVYSNARFKEVTVQQTGEHKFLIKGKAQVFEASFSWVVEDGHNEIKKGHEMTDAGAPVFGNFSFIVDVAKQRKNSTLHLILFEVSAKDGSRQYELPILLY